MQGLAQGLVPGVGVTQATQGVMGAWDRPPRGERDLDDVCGPADGPAEVAGAAVRFPGFPPVSCALPWLLRVRKGHHDGTGSGPAAE